MKAFLNSALGTFSMFSRVPMPQKRIKWDKDGMKYMMEAFPLVGILIAAVILLWTSLTSFIDLPIPLRSLGLTLIPIGLTGAIHLDGLADTGDALGANTTPERRREILKDPRSGAFAIISVCIYMIAYFGLALAFDWSPPSVILLCLGFVLTRAMSGIGVSSFKSAKDGTVKMFRDAAASRTVVTLGIVALLCLAIGVILFLAGGYNLLPLVIWAVTTLGCFLYLKYTAIGKFGGMSGDLAGWFLQLCELWQLAAIVVSAFLIEKL